jgi:hypothetical protein
MHLWWALRDGCPLLFFGYTRADKIENQGDLEADYIQYLANVQKAAKENPMDVEFDFT